MARFGKGPLLRNFMLYAKKPGTAKAMGSSLGFKGQGLEVNGFPPSMKPQLRPTLNVTPVGAQGFEGHTMYEQDLRFRV